MRIVTVGGATVDMYLMQHASDQMTLTQKDLKIDYVLLRSGSKIEVDQIVQFVGGGSTNAAVSFKRQGFNDVATFCNIGKDAQAGFVINELNNYGINTLAITSTDHIPTGTSFIIKSGEKDRTILAHRGANELLNKNAIPYKLIEQADLVYITSLNKKAAELLPLITRFAHDNNIKVAINPGMGQLLGGAKLIQESLPFIDTFILNYEEAKNFMLSLAEDNASFKDAFTFTAQETICPLDIIESPRFHEDTPYLIDNPIPCDNLSFGIRHFFKQMLALGPKTVVVTNSANGVYVCNNNTIYFHPSLKMPVIDTVGAGDSFGSCFVGSLLQNNSIEKALRRGVINAASVLKNIGAKGGLLSHEELAIQEKTIDPTLLKSFTL